MTALSSADVNRKRAGGVWAETVDGCGSAGGSLCWRPRTVGNEHNTNNNRKNVWSVTPATVERREHQEDEAGRTKRSGSVRCTGVCVCVCEIQSSLI